MGEYSPREEQVLRLMLDGMSNKQIGHALGISHRTVEVHRSSIMLKSGARNLFHLARVQALAEPYERETVTALQRRVILLHAELARIRDDIDRILSATN